MIPLLLCSLVLFIPCLSELITVDTSRGSVQGFDHDFGSDKSQRFFGYGQMFLGIPFAKAPLGERRFTLPEDICQYNDRGDAYDATYYRARCWQTYDALQTADYQDEDCLYLNVMTPNVSGSYPVMVYIHGGTFTTGGADVYHWKGAVRNLVSRGVVVVTIQYRLGMLGFFTTYTETFPPNRGLYDQILALRWVNEEIANFGGDASRITIFGQSAGATSVSDLSLSPLARGLFYQLIQTSGSALQEIETITDPRGSIHQNRALQLCQIDSSDWGSPSKDQAILSCLLQTTPQDLIAYDFSDFKDWAPAIDGAFFPDYPENLAASRPKYPTLIGDVLEEIAFVVPGVEDGDISNVTAKTDLEMLQHTWPIFDDATARNISEMTIAGYADGVAPAPDDHIGWAKLITQMGTGSAMDADMIRDVQWHQKAGNDRLWLFTFAHRSLLPFNKTIEGWTPIAHCSDLPYLWFYPDIWETYNATDADYAVADYMGGLWTDFAKNGERSLPKAQKEMNYVEIGDLPALKSNWRTEANTVFNEQISAYLGAPLQTISDESWAKLKTLGEKVVSKWNSMKCPIPVTTVPSTTKGTLVASYSVFSYVILMHALCFRE